MNKEKEFDRYTKFQNPERYYVNEFVKKASEEIPAESKVLDAGAGECVYRKYFSHCDYVSSDYCVGDEHWDYKKIDLVCKLSDIPVKDETFDYILCTQTLEHVPDPDKVISELGRVLKKNGKLFISAPFIHAEHQIPYDFYRYTQYGLRHLLESNNFKNIQIAHGGGYLIVSGNFLKHMPALIFKNRCLAIIKWPMLVITNIIYKILILIDDNNKDNPNGPTFNYLVTATKN